MIKLQVIKLSGGGPGTFMKRLLSYMEEHEIIKVVNRNGDIYFSTVWQGDKPKGCKHVHRAAAVYYDTNQKKRHGLNKKIAKVVKSADHVIFQTKFARKMHVKILKASPSNFSIIHNGFDTNQYRTVEPAKIECDGPMFVACSNWSNPAKRLPHVIKAFRWSQVPNAKLFVLGGNASGKKPDNVYFQGKMTIEEIVSYLKHKPIFIHLCYAESCPNVVVEALSFGCPVVCNNIGGTPEIVKDDGVISECDKKFIFKRVNVNMSIHNWDSLLDGIKLAAQKNWDINRPDLSMEHCSSLYKSAFMETLGERK